jgi:hypothetical protein
MTTVQIHSHKHRGYDITITNTPPLFQAAIYASNSNLPDIDWKLQPVRATKLSAALNLAKRRIDDVIAQAAA